MALCPCPCTTVGRLAPIPRPRERFKASSGAARVCGQQFFMLLSSPSHTVSPAPPAAPLPQSPFSQPSFPQSPSHFMKKLSRPRPRSQPTAQFLHKPKQRAPVLRRRRAATRLLGSPSRLPQSPSHFMKKLSRPRPHSQPTAQFLHKPEQHASLLPSSPSSRLPQPPFSSHRHTS